MREGIRDFIGHCVASSLLMRESAPVLASAVSEIAAHKLHHNPSTIGYAVAGAGVMRALHIQTDRKLAA